MKVLEVIPDLRQRAGAEVFFDSLCMQLENKKDLEIVVVVIWDLIDESFIHLKNDERIKFYCCGKKKAGIDFKSIKRFKKIVEEEKPDIIHTHRSIALTYFLSFGFKRKPWRYIHTVHNIATKEAGKYEIFLRKKYAKRGLIEQIGISDLISKTIVETYKKPVAATIYNGIKLPEIKDVKKEYDFVCVARFSKQKNHMLLLETFKEYLIDNPTAKLLLVGGGELLDQCKQYAEKEGLLKNVVFYGHTPNAVELMNKSKVFVLSSLYEGNPISVLEAMSLGLPIIAPKVGGIPDVVENEKNGFLFEVGDKNALLECMKNALTDESKYFQLSGNNLKKSQQFSIENCAESYYSFFKNRK